MPKSEMLREFSLQLASMITDDPGHLVNRMNPKHSKTSIRIRLIAAGTCFAFFAGCATTPQTAG
ncbi:MAG: hypothetical protein WAN04_07565, partial [Candidatus Udaeobacter sp.]